MSMKTARSPLEQVTEALLHPTNHIVGLVDALLAACQEDGLRLDWQGGHCRIRSSSASPEGVIGVPLRKAVFRAILARLAVLCNERRPNSVSPYGGQGEVVVGADPAMVFRVEFVNTPDEQRLELTQRRRRARPGHRQPRVAQDDKALQPHGRSNRSRFDRESQNLRPGSGKGDKAGKGT
jgi:hypothetical protein